MISGVQALSRDYDLSEVAQEVARSTTKCGDGDGEVKNPTITRGMKGAEVEVEVNAGSGREGLGSSVA